jgi:phage terminase large subunit-like protein
MLPPMSPLPWFVGAVALAPRCTTSAIFRRLKIRCAHAFTSDFDLSRAGYSPDRVDALVWALTGLSIRMNT